MPEFAGFVQTAAGAPNVGLTVNLYARNDHAGSVAATTTTDSNGYWTISHGTEGLFDVEIVIDASNKFRRRYDDEFQVSLGEFGELFLRGTDDAFTLEFQSVPSESRIATFPDNTGVVAELNLAQTWSAIQTHSVDLYIATTKRLFLDGGGDTHLQESAANRVDLTVGGSLLWRQTITAFEPRQDVHLEPTKKLYFDGGNDTYITEESADDLQIVVGGVIMLGIDQDALQLELGGYLNLLKTDNDATVEGGLWYDASEDKLKFKTAAGVETITSS